MSDSSYELQIEATNLVGLPLKKDSEMHQEQSDPQTEQVEDEHEMGVVNGVRGEVVPGRYTFVAPEATRFEIYPAKGKMAHVVTLEPGASIHIQDDGRTIKIFTKESADSREWFNENHDWSEKNRTSRISELEEANGVTGN